MALLQKHVALKNGRFNMADEQVPLCLEAYNFEVQGRKALNLCFWVAFLMISKCTNFVGKSFSVLEIWPLKITKNVALNDF